MRYKQRSAFYNDVVPFPATKSAGAMTLYGDVLKPFEANPGPLDLHLVAEDDSQITDLMTMKLEVSYDGGENWIEVDEYSELENGSGDPVSVLKDEVLEFAPMVRVNAVFNTDGELAEGHGCSVKAFLKEDEDFQRSQVFTDVVDLPAELADTNKEGESFNVANAQKVIVVSSGDTDNMTNITFNLQSSFDGENWWNVGNSAKDISALSFNEEVFSSKLGTYFRVDVIAGATGLAEDHNLKFNLIALHY